MDKLCESLYSDRDLRVPPIIYGRIHEPIAINLFETVSTTEHHKYYIKNKFIQDCVICTMTP